MEKNTKLHLHDIVEIVAYKQNISKEEAEVFVKTLFSVVQESVSEDKPIKIKDFGTFKLTLIHARESVDVNTGEKIEIPAHYRFSFHPATALRELVNKPFSNFETTLLHDEFQHTDLPHTSENEEDSEDEGIVFVVEETDTFDITGSTEEEIVVTVEEEVIIESEPSSSERKLHKHAFSVVFGIAVASIALLTVGLMCSRRKRNNSCCC